VTGSVVCILHITAVASLWVVSHAPPAAAGGALARSPRAHPWLGAHGSRHAVAVHRPTHRWDARAGDIACSTHCCEVERLASRSPPAGSACPLHAPGSVACHLQQQPWGSPGAGTACHRRERRNDPCRLEQRPWSSPHVGIVCLLRAPCSIVRLQRTWNSPPLGTACRLHAPCSSACRLERTSSSPRAGTACRHRAPCSAPRV
jgi:hypothetical protein